MRNISRRYQVKVVSSSPFSRPIVQGFEEIDLNGKCHVRYLNDDDWLEAERLLDACLSDSLLVSPWFEAEVNRWFADRASPRSLRSCPPEVIEVKPQRSQSASPRGAHWQAQLGQTWQRLQRMVHNVPSAVKAAWRELKR